MTWADIHDLWRESMRQAGLSPATVTSYGWAMHRFQRVMGAESPREVTPEFVRRYIGQMQDLSIETVNLFVRAARRFFGQQVADGKLLSDPTEGLRTSRSRRVPEVLTADEMHRLIESASKLRDRAILEVLWATGMRIGELCALAVGDVEPDAMRVRSGKGSKGRVVPLTEAARRALVAYLALRGGSGQDPLWIVRGERRLSVEYWRSILRGYGRAIGRRVTVHAIRRSVATQLLRAGAPPMIVRDLLGHASTKVLAHYARVAPVEVKGTHQRAHPRP